MTPSFAPSAEERAEDRDYIVHADLLIASITSFLAMAERRRSDMPEELIAEGLRDIVAELRRSICLPEDDETPAAAQKHVERYLAEVS